MKTLGSFLEAYSGAQEKERREQQIQKGNLSTANTNSAAAKKGADAVRTRQSQLKAVQPKKKPVMNRPAASSPGKPVGERKAADTAAKRAEEDVKKRFPKKEPKKTPEVTPKPTPAPKPTPKPEDKKPKEEKPKKQEKSSARKVADRIGRTAVKAGEGVGRFALNTAKKSLNTDLGPTDSSEGKVESTGKAKNWGTK